MNNTTNTRLAEDFAKYIRMLAEKPENLENLEHYLSAHFHVWMVQYASTPENFVAEMREFATMEI